MKGRILRFRGIGSKGIRLDAWSSGVRRFYERDIPSTYIHTVIGTSGLPPFYDVLYPGHFNRNPFE